MASRLTVFPEGAFGKASRGKKHIVWAVCALLGLTLASELGKAQNNTTHPPVISTSTQWTLDAPVLASSSPSAAPSNGFSQQGGFSPDGTHLLFWSRSSNIVPGATNGASQLYIKDLTTGTVSVVSASATGAEGTSDTTPPNNSSQILMFSPDGTKVVFESVAANLLATGTNGRQQIFIKDLTTNAVSLVSVDASGTLQGDGNSMNFTFSPDGTKIAFDSASTNLIPGGTTGNQVFVKDLASGVVTLVSTDSSGVPGNGASSYPVFSPDGNLVAFVSNSNNLAAGGTNNHSQIYVKNLQSGATTVASTDAAGNEANNDSLYPVFSPEGSKLAFNSISTNLVSNVPSSNSEVYVKDLALGTITLVSTDANGVPANGNSTQLGAFSPDSTKIAFQSASLNLISGLNGASQVFVKDLLTGSITLASANAAGVVGNGNSTMPTFSPDHLALAFQSGAGNFGVTNFTSQIFVRPIFTASGAVMDNSFAPNLSTAGQLSFSDADTTDTHTASVTTQASNLGALKASISKDSTGTGGVVLWSYQVSESQLHGLTSPATDNFTLTLTDSQGCIATTAIVVTALPQDFAVTNTTGGTTPTSVSTSTSSCPTLAVISSPSSLSVTSGQSASFSATATGSPAPTVQWQVSADGGATFTDLPGATSTTLTFAADMSQNGYLYRAVFTNTSGSVTTSAATLTVNTTGATTTLASSKDPTVFGQAVTFTATVSSTTGAPTGTVTFLDGGLPIGTATLDSTGAASLTNSALAVGNHAITASYSGDSNFNAATSSPFTQIVNLDVPTVAISVSPNPSVFGQSLTATTTVSASAPGSGTPTGKVTFSDRITNLGATNLVNGQASFTISSLTAGLHSIVVTYGGDGSFSQNSSATGITVNKVPTTTSLTSSANPSSFNQAVTFTVTVRAATPGVSTVTGTVAFTDGGATLGTATLDSAGAASLTASSLASGTHTIIASYSGDANFSASNSAPLSQVVGKMAATATLTSSANPSVFGQNVTFTITVAAASGSGTPTGAVSLQDGSGTMSTLTLVNSQASFTTSALSPGSHSITAAYNGDANFNAASSMLLETVSKDASLITPSSSANPSVFGQSVVVTATVSAAAPGAGTPTGAVTFSDGVTSLGSANLANGQASFTLSAPGIGSHSITANYAGDGNFSSSSSTVAQTVNKASTSTALTSSPNPSTISQSVTFTAAVTVVAPGAGTPTGSVTFNDGSNQLANVPLGSNGTATFTTPTMAVNSHSITAVYSGDVNFNSSTGRMTQNVQYGICAQYDQTRSVQGGATFPIKVEVCDANGNDLSSQSIALHATAIIAASGVAGPVQDSGNANPDYDFRNVGGSGQNASYIFNLSTSGLTTGTYALQFTVTSDPVLHTVFFGVN